VERALAAGCRVVDVVGSTDPDVRRSFLTEACANLVVEERNTKLCLRFPLTLLENASAATQALSKLRANPLPRPETVLSQPKNARPQDDCDGALFDWWTKVKEVRTACRATISSRVFAENEA
jgi:hypothetical protein